MLDFPTPAPYQASKCYVTHGTMGHLDPQQLPSDKRQPWAALANQDFIHKLDVLVPEEIFGIVNKKLVERPPPVFKKVIMSLADILSADFLREYVKLRNTFMLSQGRILVDNVITLKNGKLTLFVDRETYERAGLVGKPQGVKGGRHLKPRWIIEFDLLSPTMVPGKKGFERLVSASKNVFSQPQPWLFCDSSSPAPTQDPLASHHPIAVSSNPKAAKPISVKLPPLKPGTDLDGPDSREVFREFSAETYEWLSMLRLESPRVCPEDRIDPFLSLYQTPGNPAEQSKGRVVKISWEGFFCAAWAREILVELLVCLPPKTWFALSVTSFPTGVAGGNTDCTFLRPPNAAGEFVLWEVKGHE